MSQSSFVGSTWSWLVARRWRLVVLMLLVANMIFAAKVYKTFRHEMASIQSDIKEIQTRFSELSEIPFAYAETPVGLKLVPAKQGVTKAEINFIARYRGPLELRFIVVLAVIFY